MFLPDDYVHDEHLPSTSQDKTVNEYGKLLLEVCKATGMRLVNGRCGADNNIGKLTCVNVQGGIGFVLCRTIL